MKILIGVCGGISAHKAPSIISGIKKAFKAEIDIVITPNALKYATESALMNVVGFQHFHPQWLPGIPTHIELTNNIDMFLLLSATANTIGKINSGISDNILTDCVSALDLNIKKIMVPAMNTRMWENKITQNNMSSLINNYGWDIMQPDTGQLACGTTGIGKLPKTATIIKYISEIINA